MKKVKTIPVIFLALLFFSSYNVKAYEEDMEFEINTELKVPNLRLKQSNIILDFKSDDVNGDKIKDNVLLVGYKVDTLCKEVKVIVQDGKSKDYHKVSIGRRNTGLNPKLFLGDFNGDKVLDIFVSLYSGRNGGCSFYSLLSFIDNKPNFLFKQEHFSKGLSFDIKYTNNFNVKVFNKDVSKYFSIDVSSKKDTYIVEGIYNKAGKLLKFQEGYNEYLNELAPMDIDKDGVYELKAIQKLNGICNADTLGYVKVLWKYENSTMNLLSLEILPYAKAGEMQKIRRVIPVGNFN